MGDQADGTERYGEFAPGEQWHSNDLLAYGMSYRVQARVRDRGITTERTTTFDTLKPDHGVTASVFPSITTPVPWPYGGWYLEAMASHVLFGRWR